MEPVKWLNSLKYSPWMWLFVSAVSINCRFFQVCQCIFDVLSSWGWLVETKRMTEKLWDDVTAALQSMTYNSRCLRSSHLTVSWCLRVTSFPSSVVLLSSTHAPSLLGCGREVTLWLPQTKQRASLSTPATAQTGPSSATTWWWRTWINLMKESGAVRLVCGNWCWWNFQKYML